MWDAVFRPYTTERFKAHLDMNVNVGILRLFPGITQASIHSFFQPPMEGVILQTYGAGNVPDSREDLLQELRSASNRGVIIVNCSQCPTGYVSEKYAAGRILRDCDVIPGHDMTPEAALTKLSYLLSKSDLTLSQKRELMEKNLRGEMAVFEEKNEGQFSLNDSQILKSVAELLHTTSKEEVKLLRRALLPPLMCTAAASGDLDSLRSLKRQGGDVSLSDYAGLTPLHLAAREGHYEVVHFLLTNGASVHMRDAFDHTPLHGAIKFKHFDTIKLLVQTGAHIIATPEVGAKLCQASITRDIDLLKAWKLAGVDLTTSDYGGNTSLSVAKERNFTEVINYLERNL
jgi:lysophospholipase